MDLGYTLKKGSKRTKNLKHDERHIILLLVFQIFTERKHN